LHPLGKPVAAFFSAASGRKARSPVKTKAVEYFSCERPMSNLLKNHGYIPGLAACVLVSVACAQSPDDKPASGVHNSAAASDAAGNGVASKWTGKPSKHPLMPALRWIEKALPRIERIKSYTATLITRERINGKLGPRESMAIKIRHDPFSIYVKSLGPASMKGQEALYIEGANNGKMWAHGVGLRGLSGTVAIDPDGPVAMQGQRYPLTEIGILRLAKRLIEVAQSDIQYDECTVKLIEHVKINGRPGRCLEVVHPKPRKNFTFHIARVFIDGKLDIPVRYECYGWPSGPKANPPLIEEYTYLDVKLNADLTAEDFDVHNPAYGFRTADGEMLTKSESSGSR
jgi:hypothetical protein